ncbi:MAG TPA: TraB/GumN family protein [Steroidobacteraceae bacterium]|nr:TraB/GumN family protein [Steroidobacteraceae bacterium]
MRELRGWLLASAAAACMAVAPARAEPALWKVTGGDNTVWLFGSVHLLPEGGFAIGNALGKAIDGAERVCLEIDPSGQDEAATTSVTLARAVDPEGRDLFELLGADADKVREAAGKAGVPLDALAMFEPWFAGLTVSLMAIQAHGYDVQHGVEQIIQAEASKAGKPSCGLETLDGQLGMLDSLPGKLQNEILLQALEEADDIEALIGPMLDAWRRGDEAGLEKSLEEDFEGYPELAEALIYRRNARWAEQVSDMLAGDDDVLVVVGAMHLVGERGLPALLEKRGYEVERR